MCKKMFCLIVCVLALGFASGVASGDVQVLLDFEGVDSWDSTWDVENDEAPLGAQILPDAPAGSTNSLTWTLPADSVSEFIWNWSPNITLPANTYSYVNFYTKLSEVNADSGMGFGFVHEAAEAGAWFDRGNHTEIPGIVADEWTYVSVPLVDGDFWDEDEETDVFDFSEITSFIMFLGNWDTEATLDVSFDYVTLSTTPGEGMVPEPATMSLLALGGLGLIRRRRNG